MRRFNLSGKNSYTIRLRGTQVTGRQGGFRGEVAYKEGKLSTVPDDCFPDLFTESQRKNTFQTEQTHAVDRQTAL